MLSESELPSELYMFPTKELIAEAVGAYQIGDAKVFADAFSRLSYSPLAMKVVLLAIGPPRNGCSSD